MFWNKKINSEEFELLHKKLVLMVGDIDELKLKVNNLKTEINSLRGRFNREGVKEEPKGKTEDLNNSVFLSNDGLPIGN